jgi:lysozyme family protein
MAIMDRPADLPPSDHYPSIDHGLLAKEYTWLWSQLPPQGGEQADKNAEARRAATNAMKGRARYQTVEAQTGVPWFFIAAIHYREASQSWKGCLHNGDPWNEITKAVPAGRGPWNSWEEAAVDALQFEGYANLQDWRCGDVFRRLELYNGAGYRTCGIRNFACHKQGKRKGTFDGIYYGSMQDTTPRNASPYIYNGTLYYEKGVSIEDHSFYPDAIDDNVGVMLFLKILQDVSGETFFEINGPEAGPLAAPVRLEQEALDILQTLGQQASVPKNVIAHMFDIQLASRPGKMPRFWAACDFTKRSDTLRFHVFDRIDKTVTSHLCAHGQGSEADKHDGMATAFSNMPGSNQSSLGVFRCAETYEGKHGLSLRIDGLEPTNSNARDRDIVIHSAAYVSSAVAQKYGRVGCSNGCFALSEEDKQGIIDVLKNGSLLVSFA